MTTVYDLTMANYGLERGLNDDNCAASYDEVKAYTPAWRRKLPASPARILSVPPASLPITPIKPMVGR